MGGGGGGGYTRDTSPRIAEGMEESERDGGGVEEGGDGEGLDSSAPVVVDQLKFLAGKLRKRASPCVSVYRCLCVCFGVSVFVCVSVCVATCECVGICVCL